MTTRILYDSSNKVAGKMLAQFVDSVKAALAEGRRVKAALDSASSGADWTAVAAELGGGITALQAQDAWTILSTAMTAIDVAAVAELARLDQG